MSLFYNKHVVMLYEHNIKIQFNNLIFKIVLKVQIPHFLDVIDHSKTSYCEIFYLNYVGFIYHKYYVSSHVVP